MSESICIAAAQMDVALGDREGNRERVESLLAQAARRGARLVAFPECSLSGYCVESLEEALSLAEPIPGPTTLRLAETCKRLSVHMVVGLIESDFDRVFNTCALIGPGEVLATYRKLHLPFMGLDRFATPGDRPFAVHTVGPLRVGLSICYDVSFPESSRVLALAGADLIVLPTNWPPAASCVAECTINTRAMENNIYYLAVNRIGTERGFSFIGRSRICEPTGRTLATAEHDRPEVLYAEIDPALARNKHLVRIAGKHEIDRFRDRRPEMYGAIVAPKAE